jgi:3-isopropylmalate dehydratase small subunit
MIKEIVMSLEKINKKLNDISQENKEKQVNLQAQLIAEDEEAAYWNHITNMQNDIDKYNDSDGPWFWETK